MLAILTTPERRARIQEMGYLCYEDPSRAIHALGVLARYSEALKRGPSAPPPALPSGAPRLSAGLAINEVEGKRILAAVGVPARPSERIAGSPSDAAEAAEAAGFPVVMKIVSRRTFSTSPKSAASSSMSRRGRRRRRPAGTCLRGPKRMRRRLRSTACWSRRWFRAVSRPFSASSAIRCSARWSCSGSAAFSSRS